MHTAWILTVISLLNVYYVLGESKTKKEGTSNVFGQPPFKASVDHGDGQYSYEYALPEKSYVQFDSKRTTVQKKELPHSHPEKLGPRESPRVKNLGSPDKRHPSRLKPPVPHSSASGFVTESSHITSIDEEGHIPPPPLTSTPIPHHKKPTLRPKNMNREIPEPSPLPLYPKLPSSTPKSNLLNANDFKIEEKLPKPILQQEYDKREYDAEGKQTRTLMQDYPELPTTVDDRGNTDASAYYYRYGNRQIGFDESGFNPKGFEMIPDTEPKDLGNGPEKQVAESSLVLSQPQRVKQDVKNDYEEELASSDANYESLKEGVFTRDTKDKHHIPKDYGYPNHEDKYMIKKYRPPPFLGPYGGKPTEAKQFSYVNPNVNTKGIGGILGPVAIGMKLGLLKGLLLQSLLTPKSGFYFGSGNRHSRFRRPLPFFPHNLRTSSGVNIGHGMNGPGPHPFGHHGMQRQPNQNFNSFESPIHQRSIPGAQVHIQDGHDVAPHGNGQYGGDLRHNVGTSGHFQHGGHIGVHGAEMQTPNTEQVNNHPVGDLGHGVRTRTPKSKTPTSKEIDALNAVERIKMKKQNIATILDSSIEGYQTQSVHQYGALPPYVPQNYETYPQEHYSYSYSQPMGHNSYHDMGQGNSIGYGHEYPDHDSSSNAAHHEETYHHHDNYESSAPHSDGYVYGKEIKSPENNYHSGDTMSSHSASMDPDEMANNLEAPYDIPHSDKYGCPDDAHYTAPYEEQNEMPYQYHDSSGYEEHHEMPYETPVSAPHQEHAYHATPNSAPSQGEYIGTGGAQQNSESSGLQGDKNVGANSQVESCPDDDFE